MVANGDDHLPLLSKLVTLIIFGRYGDMMFTIISKTKNSFF